MVSDSQRKRLADAIDALAVVISEIIADRVRTAEAESKTKANALPAAAPDLLNKKQLAQRLGIGLRTVDTWIRKRYVPYIKYGKLVRFRWSEVERYLERLEVRPRW